MKNNLYTLYDLAKLGITSHSKGPIRLATRVGFTLSALSLLVSIGYLVLKLLFWDQFVLGTAPLLIGECVAAIHTRVMKRPLVVEKERVNFDES